MSAEVCLREGRLADALAELQVEVRREPANAKYRVFLFQLLAVMGEWERALVQLNVAGELDPGTLAMVSTYREALRCEALRRDVFAGQHTPLIFGEPLQWMALLVEALSADAAHKHGQAQAMRTEAFELAEPMSGTLENQSFTWIADADQRLGPMLEAIINGRYYWVPFQHLSSIQIEAPVDLRDLAWIPAHLSFPNGGGAVALIPTRYPRSEESEDVRICMARRTEWVELAPDYIVGLGQRMFATDVAEYPMLEVRLINIERSDNEIHS